MFITGRFCILQFQIKYLEKIPQFLFLKTRSEFIFDGVCVSMIYNSVLGILNARPTEGPIKSLL